MFIKSSFFVAQESFYLGVVADQSLLPVNHCSPAPDNGKCRCTILSFLPFFHPFSCEMKNRIAALFDKLKKFC